MEKQEALNYDTMGEDLGNILMSKDIANETASKIPTAPRGKRLVGNLTINARFGTAKPFKARTQNKKTDIVEKVDAIDDDINENDKKKVIFDEALRKSLDALLENVIQQRGISEEDDNSKSIPNEEHGYIVKDGNLLTDQISAFPKESDDSSFTSDDSNNNGIIIKTIQTENGHLNEPRIL